MLIRVLPLIAGLAPIVGVNLAYWLGVHADVLPTCIPYLEGCTSISATGRYPPGNLLFRAVMLPQAVVLALTWHFAVLWLRSIDPRSSAATRVMVFGLLGAVSLIIYVTFLGTKEPFYEFMRRFGIYLYFVGTVFAQLAFTLGLRNSRWRKAMLWTVVLPFGLGFANFVQKALLPEPDRLENTIEWIVSLLMQVWFVFLYLAWRDSNFSIRVESDRTQSNQGG